MSALPPFAASLLASLALVATQPTSMAEGTAGADVRPGRTRQVFVVAGQSNARGYNHIGQYRRGREPFPEALRVQTNVWFWPGVAAPDGNRSLWTHLVVGASGAFGPEIGFGHDLARRRPGTEIAIIKFAAGGTGIARSADYTDYIPALAGFDDKDNNWHPPADGRPAGTLYASLVANVRAALTNLASEGTSAELAGVVWMQGEHEAGISRRMAEDYARLLGDLIASLRRDLQAPALPFIIGQVNSHTWAYGDLAREGQAAVCRADQRTRLVETLDLPRVPGDAAHFDADGMLLLGTRCAQSMSELLAAP